MYLRLLHLGDRLALALGLLLELGAVQGRLLLQLRPSDFGLALEL